MKNKKYYGLIVAVLILAVFIGFKVISAGKTPDVLATQENQLDLGIPTEVVTVNRDSMVEGISYIGTLESRNTLVLSPKVGAQVTFLNIEEGSLVKEGDIVARLDDRQWVAKMETLQKKIETLQVNYSYVGQEVDNYFITNPILKKIDTLELNLSYLNDQENKFRMLLEQGAVAEGDYDKVKHERDVLKAQLEELNATFAEGYKKLVSQRDTLAAQMDELQGNVNELAISIQDARIIASRAGKVRMLYYDIGDMALAGKPFAIIDDTENLTVKVNISEQDLNKIEIGTRALLNITGISEKRETSITRIMPRLNGSTRIGEVQMDLNALNLGNIVVGTSVQVDFVVQEIQDEIIISKRAIKSLKDKEFVYIIENNIAREQEITKGLVVGDKVQVLEGLATGEEIAMNNLTKLYDGAKVHVLKGEDI
ncbi:efflux RND transporter periplasmic adaptor subunit [Petrocella sp. FN5]|uniref:efflux RND transporter periplasmic adaptor subunit n=1 Tax=Petrocella sp. FN5 TaxID=3032002 RepID=UPI0023DB4971|nr:HlyD family efflux transporter periplasmic adaptor subunit [Petrocella sp. FN5]MDF1618638.1 efflux RND transporter periplasmic adaptor subunit [Petrocella sp. FN5]